MPDVPYYFNAYVTPVWVNPDNLVDGDTGAFAASGAKKTVQVLTGNTCPGTDLGTITKVELRVFAKGDGNDRIDITPVFTGGDGDVHETTPVVDPGDWTGYVDITNDTNHPDWSAWSQVQSLDCIIDNVAVAKGNVMYASKVEIRVTYWAPPVSDIDVGAAPIDRDQAYTYNNTLVDKNNPANASGVLHSVKVYALTNITDLRVGTFYTTNGNTLKCRDSELVGNVEAGAERTFTELSISVEVGDYIGCYFTAGSIERDLEGYAGFWYIVGEYIDPNDETEYSFYEGDAISLYGYGDIAAAPTVTTQAASNIGTTSATLNGEITDVGGEDCDERGFESRHTPSVQTTLGVGNPHEIVYYDGFVYTCHRVSPGKVVKTSVTNYASKSTLTPQHNATDATELADIIYAAGYLWACDWSGWVYKIDLASFTVSAAYQPVVGEADCLCSDGTYVYVGYDTGHIGKITISTGDTSSNDLGNQKWHGLVEDGDYLYGNDNYVQNFHKIAKSDLTSVDSVSLGYCCDDMAQDSTYVYLGREGAVFGLVRVQKSDLSLSVTTPPGIGVAYGVFLIGSQILLLDADNNWIWVFESDLSSKKAPLSGLDDASPPCELVEDGDGNFHITQWKATDAPLVKINKHVILDAFDWTETDSYGVGAFDHIVTGLHPSITYKYRAKAHNSGGWGYGNEVEFDTIAVAAPENTVYLVKATGKRTQLSVGAVAIRIDPATGRRSLDTTLTKFLVREDDGTLRAKSA